MTTLWKYSYYVYLVIVAILLFEGIARLGSNTKWGIILIALAAVVLLKFFMTRKLRRNLEKRNQQK
jgi:positive regulator of sigma E activity